MKDLAVGDRVLVSEDKYEPIYSFGHYAPDKNVKMVQFTTASKSKFRTIRLTPDHLISVVSTNDSFIPASHVRTGDTLTDENGDELLVLTIRVVNEQGLYAPFTPSGKLIENGNAICADGVVCCADGVLSVLIPPMTAAKWLFQRRSHIRSFCILTLLVLSQCFYLIETLIVTTWNNILFHFIFGVTLACGCYFVRVNMSKRIKGKA